MKTQRKPLQAIPLWMSHHRKLNIDLSRFTDLYSHLIPKIRVISFSYLLWRSPSCQGKTDALRKSCDVTSSPSSERIGWPECSEWTEQSLAPKHVLFNVLLLQWVNLCAIAGTTGRLLLSGIFYDNLSRHSLQGKEMQCKLMVSFCLAHLFLFFHLWKKVLRLYKQQNGK